MPFQRQIRMWKERGILFSIILKTVWFSRLPGVESKSAEEQEALAAAPLVHALVRWLALQGIMEGWIKPLVGDSEEDLQQIIREWDAAMTSYSTRIDSMVNRLPDLIEAFPLLLEQQEAFLERWDLIRPLVLLGPPGSKIAVGPLLQMPISAVQDAVLIATQKLLAHQSFCWQEVVASLQDPPWQTLCEKLDPGLTAFLATKGLEPRAILIRLTEHPLCILSQRKIWICHLSRCQEAVRREVLLRPWAFVRLAEIWPDLGKKITEITEKQAQGFVRKAGALRAMVQPGTMRFENMAAVLFAMPRLRSAVRRGNEDDELDGWDEPGDLATPSTHTRHSRIHAAQAKHVQ